MALGPRLEQRLGQSLVMTPQLRQAIKLLQYSNVELNEFVNQLVESNPLLERQDATAPAALDGPAPSEMDRFSTDGRAGGDADSASVASSDALPKTNDAPLDADYGNVFESDFAEDGGPGGDQAGAGAAASGQAGDWGGRGGRSDFSADTEFEDTLSESKDLREHLRDQLACDLEDPSDRIIGFQLIEMLDETGYLSGETEDLAGQLGCAPEDIERVLKMLQQFDPPGVFARDLAECLALQLADQDRFDPAMAALVDRLDLVASRDYDKLKAVCQVDEEDLRDMLAEITSLNPKPGLQFESETIQTMVPDVFVSRRPDGGWAIELNSDTLPKVLVNRRYHARISKNARSTEDKAFIADQLQNANWLARSLDQRARTILKVSTEIVSQQEAFFTQGVHQLRPLTLRDIAEQVSMHESTISRVTTNKFMATPRGVYELKYFFSSAINSSEGGEAHAAVAVRQRVKELIDQEPAEKILSDDRIAEILNQDGIDIARRTVAKYREALKIPSSVQRRRIKRAALRAAKTA